MPLARRLAGQIASREHGWRRAFETTPRHLFVPSYWEFDADGRPGQIVGSDPRWLPGVYTDDSLATQITETEHGPYPTSSSSRPSLMLAILDALDVADSSRILEIGTGTGYNAALLSARLGAENIVSLDIDASLVHQARTRLGRLGYVDCTVIATDGRNGYPSRQPYDRVIATHSVEQVPYAWVEQTRPGGIILVDVRSGGTPSVGHLARLVVGEDGSTASGHFRLAEPGFFMPDRGSLAQPHAHGLATRDLRDAVERPSSIGGAVLAEPGFMFALWERLPEVRVFAGGTADVAPRMGRGLRPARIRVWSRWPGHVTCGPWSNRYTRNGLLRGSPPVNDFTIAVTREGRTITAARP